MEGSYSAWGARTLLRALRIPNPESDSRDPCLPVPFQWGMCIFIFYLFLAPNSTLRAAQKEGASMTL